MSPWFYNHVRTLVVAALTVSALFFTPTLSIAAQATLAWDPNDPVPEGYRIYQRTEGQAYDYSQPSWGGADNTGTVEGLADDTTYYFVVRAFDGAEESADSNDVSFSSPSPVLPTYTIAATSGDHGGISPEGTVSVDEDASQIFLVSPDAGYHVADVIVDGNSTGAVTTYTFNQVTANHSISAVFAVNNYTITASAGANGSISPAGITRVDHGGSQSYAITPDAGYHVADVKVDGISKGSLSSYMFAQVTGNRSIEASFSKDTYTVPQSAEATLAWDPNDPTPDGYRIYQRTGGQAYDYSQPVWTGSGTTGTVYNLDYDTTYYFVVRAYTGGQESADSNEVTFLASSPAPATYTIAVVSAGSGVVLPGNTVTVTSGADQAFSISPETGYHVADVKVDGVSVGVVPAYTFHQVAANHTLAVTFAFDTHNISASAGANGTISPSGSVSVNHGAGQTYTITADAGYQVADVLVDGVSKGAITAYTFDNVLEDHTIEAMFAAKTHTIDATAGANGTISPAGSVTVADGGSQVYTMTPDTGYHIAQVMVDGEMAGTATTHVFSDVTEDHEIVVNFEMDVFTLTAIAGEGGSISPAGKIMVNSGASQTYTLTADEGCEIQDLIIDGQSQGAKDSYTLQNICADCTIEARFTLMNQVPTADAGPDQTVDEGMLVSLSGLNSIDLDDGIAAFQWRQIQGPEVQLSAMDQPEATFTAPDVDSSGTALVFELSVTDYSDETTVDTCIVNVTWVNLPPTADAGGSQTVSEGTAVVLDAGNSVDPDDGIVEYHWQQMQGPAVTLSGDQSSVASFNTPDIGPEGASLIFQLTVTDAGGLQDTDICLVTVAWVNTPPLADAGPDQQAHIGDEVTLDGSLSTDSDGDTIVAYRWRQAYGTPVELSDATAQQPVFEVPVVDSEEETLVFELTVTDSGGMLDMDTCQVVVAAQAATEDTTVPTLAIEDPLDDIVTLRTFRINMSGSAWDDRGVETVVWKNSRGGSGVATGTSQWQADKIRLSYGTNIITITAIDAAGNATAVSKTIVVQFRWWFW
jgi:hypothetical protein